MKVQEVGVSSRALSSAPEVKPAAAKASPEKTLSRRIGALTRAGFDSEHIAVVQEKLGNLDVVAVPAVFSNTYAAAACTVDACKKRHGKPAVTVHGGIVVIAQKGDSVEKVEAALEKATDAKMAAAYETLPKFLKQWVNREMREGDGSMYGKTLTICFAVDAVLCARTLKTEKAIRQFSKLSAEERDRRVPRLNDPTVPLNSKVLPLAIVLCGRLDELKGVPEVLGNRQILLKDRD